jgi:uncharacterized protein
MTRDEAIRRLRELLPEAEKRFGVSSLRLFGSTARDKAGPDSDLDLLVAFDGPSTSARYFGLMFLLEDELGVPINLVTEKALRADFRPYVEREAVAV